jgi:hypothetical protein
MKPNDTALGQKRLGFAGSAQPTALSLEKWKKLSKTFVSMKRFIGAILEC